MKANLKSPFAPVAFAVSNFAALTATAKALLFGALAAETEVDRGKQLKAAYVKLLEMKGAIPAAINKVESLRELVAAKQIQIKGGLADYLKQVAESLKDQGVKTTMKMIIGELAGDPAMTDNHLGSFVAMFTAMNVKVAELGLDMAGMAAAADKAESPMPSEGHFDKIGGIETMCLGIRSKVDAFHEIFTALSAYESHEEYRGVAMTSGGDNTGQVEQAALAA